MIDNMWKGGGNATFHFYILIFEQGSLRNMLEIYPYIGLCNSNLSSITLIRWSKFRDNPFTEGLPLGIPFHDPSGFDTTPMHAILNTLQPIFSLLILKHRPTHTILSK